MAHTPLPASKQGPRKNSQNAPSLKRVANVVRFVVRLRMMARAWKKQEQLRKTLLAKYEEQEAQEAQSNDGLEAQPQPQHQPQAIPKPKPVVPSKPVISSSHHHQQQQKQSHQIKIKQIEQMLLQQKRVTVAAAAEHLRFGGAMSVDLEASSSTAREDHQGAVDGAHQHHGDVGADSAAEMWMSGDEEVDGLWRREDFGAPAPPPPRVEDEGFDGTEAISVDST